MNNEINITQQDRDEAAKQIENWRRSVWAFGGFLYEGFYIYHPSMEFKPFDSTSKPTDGDLGYKLWYFGETRKTSLSVEAIEELAQARAFRRRVGAETLLQSDDETVNHPSHYNQVPGIECIDVVRHFSFGRGCAIKYLWRAGEKGNLAEDLRKAIWYIQDELKQLEQNNGKL